MAVKSAARALQLLELFELLRRPAGLVEIASELGLPVSSASMLVHTLGEMGYLHRDAETHKFAPTLRLSLLGGWVKAGGSEAYVLTHLVQEAQQRTDLTAVLSTRQGINVQYLHVERATPRGFVSHRPNTGTLRPLCMSAMGQVLLCDASDEHILLMARNTAGLLRRRIDGAALLERVVQARRTGYGWQTDQTIKGVGDVAVRLPIDDSLGRPLVLSVAGASADIQSRHARIGAALKGLLGRVAPPVNEPARTAAPRRARTRPKPS